MKKIIQIVLVLILIILGVGFYLLSNDHRLGNFIVGIGVLLFTLILMPLFLYHRYKGKKLKDYILTKEKIDKMLKNLSN
ncbi:MAG TPA: hypothetical protein EYG92_12515 [Lutibacter sp.]|nr:hypothetical protein [Lutibacter sp.]